MVKSRRIKWAGHVARKGEKRIARWKNLKERDQMEEGRVEKRIGF
jgi:hypothetical protein